MDNDSLLDDVLSSPLTNNHPKFLALYGLSWVSWLLKVPLFISA